MLKLAKMYWEDFLNYWKISKAVFLATFMVFITSLVAPFVLHYTTYSIVAIPTVYGIQFIQENFLNIVPFAVLTFSISYFDWKRPGS